MPCVLPFHGFFYDAIHSLDCTVSNGSMHDESQRIKNNCGLINVLSQHLPRGTEKNNENHSHDS
jgi:hypothetical protein